MKKAMDAESYNAGLEAAAQICEKPVGIQHPTKPAGVCISTEPPAPAHARVIRGMKHELTSRI